MGGQGGGGGTGGGAPIEATDVSYSWDLHLSTGCCALKLAKGHVRSDKDLAGSTSWDTGCLETLLLLLLLTYGIISITIKNIHINMYGGVPQSVLFFNLFYYHPGMK